MTDVGTEVARLRELAEAVGRAFNAFSGASKADRTRLYAAYLGAVRDFDNACTPDAILTLCGALETAKYDYGVAYLRAALTKITKREGRFSRDHATHAANTVEDMATVAEGALAGTWEPE